MGNSQEAENYRALLKDVICSHWLVMLSSDLGMSIEIFTMLAQFLASSNSTQLFQLF